MIILLTGGASGLGRHILEKLATNRDNEIIFTYCNSKQRAELLEKKFNNIKSFYCDFRKEESINKLFDKISDLDAIVNNAIVGVTKKHFHKTNINDAKTSFKKNIIPTINITQKAIKIFRKKKFGKIITILSSDLINKPSLGWSTYTAEKSYLQSMVKSWAVENSSFRITSNSISPSFMQTELNKDIDYRVIETMKMNHPLKDLLHPKDVADVTSFLINSTQHINGMNIIINSASDLI